MLLTWLVLVAGLAAFVVEAARPQTAPVIADAAGCLAVLAGISYVWLYQIAPTTNSGMTCLAPGGAFHHWAFLLGETTAICAVVASTAIVTGEGGERTKIMAGLAILAALILILFGIDDSFCGL